MKLPSTRPRRLRYSETLRDMVADVRLSVADLIYPIFVIPGTNTVQSIPGFGDISRFSVDMLLEEIRRAAELGVKAVALFPHIDPALKDVFGTQALVESNIIVESLRQIKAKLPDVFVICDIALDPYTTHGHDGVLNRDVCSSGPGFMTKSGLWCGTQVVPEDPGFSSDHRRHLVNNHYTVELLVKQALLLARNGADAVAPSDMMDGTVGRIRQTLDENEFCHVPIISYAAKYASAFYGPFRAAVGSVVPSDGDKRNYQMDHRRTKEALLEVELDIQEGADIVIVKPAMPYLDVIQAVSSKYTIPVFAYQVSGEYSMLYYAAQQKVLDFDRAMLESLHCIKRAGANCILTYAAKHVAHLIG